MKKSTWIPLTLFALLAIMVAGCGSRAQDAPAAAPTVAILAAPTVNLMPAVTATPLPVVPTDMPTALPTLAVLLPTDTPMPIVLEVVATDTPFIVATVPALAACDCSGDTLNCGDFASGDDAQTCFDYCMATVGFDVHGLDGDGDGLFCESR